MSKGLELRGVPRRILMDGWWLASTTEPQLADAGGSATPTQSTKTNRGPHQVAFALLLILADVLFWDHTPGLSLAIFGIAVLLVAGIGRPLRVRLRSAAAFGLGATPVIDHVQPLSLAFLGIGLIVGLAMLHAPSEAFEKRARRLLGFLLGLPRHWLLSRNPAQLIPRGGQTARGTARWSWLRDWAFPIGGALIFLALLMEANPVFMHLGANLPEPWSLVRRALFWGGIAVLISPFLLSEPWQADVRSASITPKLPGLGMNPRSVLRAAVLFNVLIGVQMLADASIMIGGASLPQGMSYAEYAHRGAYPLLGTAMLAGAFALASRPFWCEHALIRPLMLLWLLQNIVLTGTAALRLELYVEAYGITYLRLYAFIWMALVAIGLMLMVWQLLRDRGTLWLMARLGTLGLATLYLSSFVNFAAIIAASNLKRPAPHIAYVCDLGPMANGALYEALRARPNLVDDFDYYGLVYCDAARPPQIHNWRDWGFRQWQVIHTIEAKEISGQRQ